MAAHRFFLTGPLEGGEPVDLPLARRDVHHLRDVLRLSRGDEIVVVPPGGDVVLVSLEDVGRDVVRGRLVESRPASDEPIVTLVQGVSKGHKMDDVVSGAVEVGVAEIRPVVTARSVVHLSPEKRRDRAERWARVAEAAAKQSQRLFVPAVGVPVELAAVLDELDDLDAILVLWEAAGGPGVRAAVRSAGLDPTSRVAVVVGPEGGLSEDEVRALESVGGIVCSLGSTVLRTETAGVVAPALVIHELGGLGNDAIVPDREREESR